MNQNKKQTVARAAAALNAESICYAAGASFLLYAHGAAEAYNDLDLVVTEADAEKADRILSAMGRKLPQRPRDGYLTKIFYEYEIDGTEIDLMAGFTLEKGGAVYVYPFDADAICGEVLVLGQPVPLCALEDWFILYRMMGRTARADAVFACLRTHGCENPQRVRLALDKPLPPALPRELRMLLQFHGEER